MASKLAINFLLILFAIPSFIVAFYIQSTPSNQIYSLHYLEKETIAVVSEYLDGYIAKYNHLPSYSEFSQWTSANEKKYPRIEGYGMWLIDANFEEDLIQALGSPVKNGYVLEFWTGDIIASYASWNKAGSAYITEKEYYPFGSKMKATFIFMILPSLTLAFWLYLIIQAVFSVNRKRS